MSSSLLMDRSAAVAPLGTTIPTFQPGASPVGTQASWCMLPRCELSFEKTANGCKIYCRCDDEISCGTLQNLCRMLCDGVCSCCVTCNGIPICQCNLTCGLTTCEFTKDGVCISCTSGDKQCCEMIQACCDCLECCCKSGCCCYISFNNTPVCCGKC